jgi:hypothetical protein
MKLAVCELPTSASRDRNVRVSTIAVGSWRNRDLSHDTRDVRFPETA